MVWYISCLKVAYFIIFYFIVVNFLMHMDFKYINIEYSRLFFFFRSFAQSSRINARFCNFKNILSQLVCEAFTLWRLDLTPTSTCPLKILSMVHLKGCYPLIAMQKGKIVMLFSLYVILLINIYYINMKFNIIPGIWNESS